MHGRTDTESACPISVYSLLYEQYTGLPVYQHTMLLKCATTMYDYSVVTNKAEHKIITTIIITITTSTARSDFQK